MQESRRNEVSADEWSETKVVRKANMEAKTIVVRKKQTRPTQRASLIRFMFFALSNR